MSSAPESNDIWTVAIPSVKHCSNFNRSEASAAIRSGKLKPDTLVWRKALQEWVPAAAVPELAVLLQTERTDDGFAAGDIAAKSRPRARRASSSGDFQRLIQRNSAARQPTAPLIEPDNVMTAQADLVSLVPAPSPPVALPAAERPATTDDRAPLTSIAAIEPPAPRFWPAVAVIGWLAAAAFAWMWWSSAARPAAPPTLPSAPVPPAAPAMPAAAVPPAPPADPDVWLPAVVAAAGHVQLSADSSAAAAVVDFVPAHAPGQWRIYASRLLQRRDQAPPQRLNALFEVHLTRSVDAAGGEVVEKIARDVRPDKDGVIDVLRSYAFKPAGAALWAATGQSETRDGPIAPAPVPEPLLVKAAQDVTLVGPAGERVGARIELRGLATVTVLGAAYPAVHLLTTREWAGRDGERFETREHAWWAKGVGRVLAIGTTTAGGGCKAPQGCDTWVDMLVETGQSAAFELAKQTQGEVPDTTYPKIFDEVGVHLPRTPQQADDMLAEKHAARAGR